MKYHFSGAFWCIYAGYNYMRQLYDTLTRPSVMQCNTTKVIRAFKCNMMAKKIHLGSDLCFISDANCHNSQGAEPCWSCSCEQLCQSQWDVPLSMRKPLKEGENKISRNIQGASSGTQRNELRFTGGDKVPRSELA